MTLAGRVGWIITPAADARWLPSTAEIAYIQAGKEEKSKRLQPYAATFPENGPIAKVTLTTKTKRRQSCTGISTV